MEKKKKYFIGIVIILGAFGALVYQGLNRSMMAYVNVSELEHRKMYTRNETLQITGIVQPGSVEMASSTENISFVLQDLQKPEYYLKVTYQGIIPDNFKPGLQVVVQGIWDENQKIMKAEQIFVKCPSKYEANPES